MKTLRVNLKGGTGNQLFTFATAVQCAIQQSRTLILSDFFLKKDKQREFDLEWLGLQPNIGYFVDLTSGGIQFQSVGKVAESKDHELFRYDGLPYTQLVIPVNKESVTLEGYFQSLKFFESISNEMSAFIRQKLPVISEFKNYNVGQIRLGDMAHVNQINKIHGYCDDNYWANAIVEIENGDPFVFVGDDLESVERFLPQTYLMIQRMNGELRESTVPEAIALIVSSTNRIISNSTFGWWGAFLAQNGKTIAPKAWFRDKELNQKTMDLYPKDWILK